MEPTAIQPASTILVTGGAGFIGSHLCERLLRQRHRVIALDNFSTGSHANLEACLGHPNFQLLEADVRHIPGDLQVDRIFNLACPASPVQYEKNPIDTLETSVLGAMQVLELAARCRATVLQASTSEVYGDPLEHPQAESYRGNVDITGPRSCYDEGKRCAETLFVQHHEHRGVKIKIVRIFNTYGPRMQADDGRVISNFVVQALRDDPLTVYGDGDQTRSFMYVSDLVEGLLRMMASEPDFIGPVNLGNPDERTINDTARRVIQHCASNSAVINKPLPQNDPLRRRPDITLARSALGWQPQVAFEEGLARTVAHFRAALDQPACAESASSMEGVGTGG